MSMRDVLNIIDLLSGMSFFDFYRGRKTFLKIKIWTVFRTNKIDRLTKQTNNIIIQDHVKKRGQENSKYECWHKLTLTYKDIIINMG